MLHLAPAPGHRTKLTAERAMEGIRSSQAGRNKRQPALSGRPERTGGLQGHLEEIGQASHGAGFPQPGLSITAGTYTQHHRRPATHSSGAGEESVRKGSRRGHCGSGLNANELQASKETREPTCLSSYICCALLLQTRRHPLWFWTCFVSTPENKTNGSFVKPGVDRTGHLLV